MDPFKLFALLVAVACCLVSAEGPKKKIRIHLPQKVKHIHHHKKIYITNHATGAQYAPGYLPSGEAAMASAVAVPAPGALMPVSSVEAFEEPARLAASGSKILPLYRARGYYGPSPKDWDDTDYDLTPPAEHSIEHSYIPSAFGAPSAPAAPATYPHKKVKVIKVNDQPRKKVPRKGKPKRGQVRAKPPLDEEIPVSTYHEQFYSDLDGSATIRKVKKPHRVEKIIDGDNEHIHTYSEEHIHKLVYDDGSSKLMGADPVASMSALSASHPIYPVKNSLLALSPETLTAFATIGSMGTPSHLEFAAYNPRDVTHDHIFHDHGEVPLDTDITKENLPFPPRVSYNNQGVPIGGLAYNNIQDKIPSVPYSKPSRPVVANEYSYYENMYSPYGKPRTPLRPTNPTSLYPPSSEATAEDYGNVSSFKLRGNDNFKPRNVAPPSYFGNNKSIFDYNTNTKQTGAASPFAVSSTVVHDYKPKSFSSQSSGSFTYNPLNPIRDPLQNFKDNSYTNNFEFDAYAAASNIYSPADKYDDASYNYRGKKGKKKSVSTQNIRIGSLDHQTTVDHMGDSGAFSINDGLQPFNPSLEFNPANALASATSTPYTIRQSSLAHPYYSAMAAQALHGEEQQPQASINNFQYVEPPAAATTEEPPVATTNIPASTDLHEQQNSEAPTEATEYVFEARQKHRTKDGKARTSTRQRYSLLDVEVDNFRSIDRPEASAQPQRSRRLRKHNTEPEPAGTLKYGDKI